MQGRLAWSASGSTVSILCKLTKGLQGMREVCLRQNDLGEEWALYILTYFHPSYCKSTVEQNKLTASGMSEKVWSSSKTLST